MYERQHVDYTDPIKLQKVGIDALKKALGPVDMVRFLRLYSHGDGINDYTAERHDLLKEDEVTIDELFDAAEALDRDDELPSPSHAGTPAYARSGV
jgi:hypothetical protein